MDWVRFALFLAYGPLELWRMFDRVYILSILRNAVYQDCSVSMSCVQNLLQHVVLQDLKCSPRWFFITI